jgi:hypothetical protein
MLYRHPDALLSRPGPGIRRYAPPFVAEVTIPSLAVERFDTARG